MKIAHIADIHVRSQSRHGEYRKVFETFVKDTKEQGVDHIFVGGDVWHTKCQGMSPEALDFFVWWFTELASVAEVHMILGNHDGSLGNSTRQDMMSPIVSAINNLRVHIYKKSGTYQFAPGFNWCIFSLFDKEGWEDVAPVPGDVNIACYHGPVWGSLTESEWEIKDGPNIGEFEKYDFLMLGDIHKFQYLGYRKSLS
jgi:predicted phosphodiesterase